MNGIKAGRFSPATQDREQAVQTLAEKIFAAGYATEGDVDHAKRAATAINAAEAFISTWEARK